MSAEIQNNESVSEFRDNLEHTSSAKPDMFSDSFINLFLRHDSFEMALHCKTSSLHKSFTHLFQKHPIYSL